MLAYSTFSKISRIISKREHALIYLCVLSIGNVIKAKQITKHYKYKFSPFYCSIIMCGLFVSYIFWGINLHFMCMPSIIRSDPSIRPCHPQNMYQNVQYSINYSGCSSLVIHYIYKALSILGRNKFNISYNKAIALYTVQ